MVQERADLVEKLDEFLSMAGATPAEIRNLALEVSYIISLGSIFINIRICIMLVHVITIVCDWFPVSVKNSKLQDY
jgi:hypothetical protein